MLIRGLTPRYLAWWCFLVLQLGRGIALSLFPLNTLSYARGYMITEPLVDIFLVISIYEWFRLLTEHYPGIKLAGTWFLNIGLGASILVCVATLGPDWRAIDWAHPLLDLILLVKRVIVGVLGVFVVLVFLAFLAYRVRVRPNVIWHGLLLMAYLWTNNILAIVDGWHHRSTVSISNSVREIAAALLYFGWGVLLTRRGEEVEFAARLTEDERYQLDKLNDELLALAQRAMKGT
jgi:hypothetical protein